MSGSVALTCERAGVQHTALLSQLFEAAGSGCFCNYWHFEGDKNAWLETCFLHPERNRAALQARLAKPDLCGVVAYGATPGELIGWLKVTRASSVPRLYDQRVYRNLACFEPENADRSQVYAVGCCYVSEPHRRSGVARQLLQAAVHAVLAAGGSALEAFPRAVPEAETLRADEMLMGPETLFLEAGFGRVSDFRPYPVLRLPLS